MKKYFNSDNEVRIHNVQIAIKDFLVEVLNKNNDEVNKEVLSWSLPQLKKQRDFFKQRYEKEFIEFYNKKYKNMKPEAEEILYKNIVRV